MIASPALVPESTSETTRGKKARSKPQQKRGEAIAVSGAGSERDRIARLLDLPIAFIPNSTFESKADPYADGVPAFIVEVEGSTNPLEPISQGLPAHLGRMCATPLLSAEQERELFRRMNYCKSRAAALQKSLRKSHRKLDEIESWLDKVERLRNYLVQANTRLVMSIARRFADVRNSFDDLLSQGVASLMHAVEKFDFDRGYRFSTYATCAVRRDLYRMVMSRKKDGARFSTGVTDQLAACTDYRSEQSGMSESSWRSLRDSLSQMLEELDDRERIIVTARFGFDEDGGKTSYSRLGERLGISKERVRQLANRALDKLRQLAPQHRLEGMLS